MTTAEVMAKLEAMSNESTRTRHKKDGATQPMFGVMMGDLRALAKAIKVDHELGLSLWKTGNLDAMNLATFVMNPKLLSVEQVEDMICTATFGSIADGVNTNIVKLLAQKEELRQKWMAAGDIRFGRTVWSLTTERVIKDPNGLDLNDLLDRIERELGSAPRFVQWTMNYCLAEIGIRYAEHRARAIAIGEKLGVFRDYPVSKGCTSPFAPIWIGAIVSRQK